MSDFPEVLLGTRESEDDMMSLCRELHADNGLFDLNEDAVREVLGRAYDKKGGIIGVIPGDGEIAAAIYMCISRMWYSHDEHLEELFSFVRPKYRKSKNAEALVEFAMRCGRDTGLGVMIGVITNKRLEAKVRLYRKKLGLPAGAFFVHGVKSWANESVMDVKDLWRVHRDKKRGNGASVGA